LFFFFFFQAEDGIRDFHVTGVQTCALPIFTYTVPSGPNQACAAGPASQPASAPSTKPASTRCQKGMASQAETSRIIEARPRKGERAARYRGAPALAITRPEHCRPHAGAEAA